MGGGLMRSQLAPFENQFAYVESRTASKRPANDGLTNLLLRNAKMRTWDGFSALDTERIPDSRVDHLWISGEADKFKPELMEEGYFCGCIHQYARSNDSVDYGIEAK